MKSTVARPFVHSAIALVVLAGSLAPARAQTPPSAPPAPVPAPATAPAPAPAPPTAPPAAYPPPTAAQPQVAPPAQPPQPYVSPAYPQSGLPPPRAPLPPPPPPKPRRGLMISGIAVFGAFYLLSVGIGASIMDGDEVDPGDDCRYCEDVGPWLFLPVAGPFVAMTQTPNDGGLVLLGLGQVVGASLMIGGIMLYKNTKRAAEAQRYGEFDLGKGRSLAVDMSTGARMVGPRMTLRF